MYMYINKLYQECCKDQADPIKIKQYISEDYDINEQDDHGWTALMWICASINCQNQLEIVKLLLDAGANVNIQNFRCEGKKTALEYICHKTPINIQIFKLLLEAGYDVNLADTKGNTILMYLCKKKCYYDYWNLINYEAVKLLIDYGADINLKNIKGKTPMDIASKYNKKLVNLFPKKSLENNYSYINI